MSGIDWNAARARIELAGDVLGAPDAEVRELIHISDDELNHGDPGPLVSFARRHGVSLDWIVCGDVRGMLQVTSREYRRPDPVR